MSRKYKFWDDRCPYFVTFTVIHWIDIFTRDIYRDVIVDSIKYCQKHKDLEVYAWSIMTNHMHMIIGSSGNPLSNIVRDLKSFTSRSIKDKLEKNKYETRKEWILKILRFEGRKNPNNHDFQLWQQHNHPIELSSDYLIHQKLEYIHLNPVKAGFVDNPEAWLYSSARDYAGRKGIVDLVFVD